MNKLTITRQNGGIPGTMSGEDHISGLMAYVATLPTADSGVAGFTATNRIIAISSIERAEELGIKPTLADWPLRVLHHQLTEVFRVNPAITLYVGLFAKAGAPTFAELRLLQNFAGGRLRQVGIWAGDVAFAAEQITTLKSVADALDLEGAPLSILYAPKITSPVSSLSTGVRGAGNSRVSMVISQAGSGVAADLYTNTANTSAKSSVSDLGVFLGLVSRAKVHQSISWVREFPTGVGLPGFGDGTLVRTLDKAVLEALDTAGYLYLTTYPGIADSFANDSHTLDVATSDYATIERVRAMDKAVRGVRSAMIPELGGNIYIDKTAGTLAPHSVSYLEGVAGGVLEEMERLGELSGYKAYIDPNQQVLSTSTIEVVLRNVPVGIARKINVKIGFSKQV